MTLNTIEIIDKGLKCLSDHLGPDETELFIATILKERFDYTKWRHTFVDKINTFSELDDFVEKSHAAGKFSGDAKMVI